jgi:F-type H+-transporting ATPase subunit delta
MAEIATIARPYAEALYKAVKASAATDVQAASVWVDELAAIAGNSQLLAFSDNPKVTAAQVLDVISGVAKTALPDMARNFLRTVIENGRLNALPEIALQFRALKNAQSGSSDAVVYSAFPIDGAALADVATALEKRFGRKLNVSVALQPELIGGIRVVVGDEVLDTSVKARLEQMKVALTD